jgi:hypothetical protein
MLLSNALINKFVDDVRKSPLRKDEVRRIAGMGEMYFANIETEAAPEFLFLYSLKVDSVEYQFFSRGASSPPTAP